jgi:hypothetical protein
MKALSMLIALMLPLLTRAEVVTSSEQGFIVRHRAELTVPQPSVWAALSEVGRWWHPEHTYPGDSRNMTLDPVVAGCFCEKLGLYGGIEHMRVVYAEPAKHLRLEGALGPLQEFAVTGRMTWDIEVAPGGARLTMTYVVGGYADRSLAEWAPIVDEVLGTQVQRLGRFINTGRPEAPAPAAGTP